MATGGHMSMQRFYLVSILGLIGGCSMMPPQPAVKPAAPIETPVAAPEKVASAPLETATLAGSGSAQAPAKAMNMTTAIPVLPAAPATLALPLPPPPVVPTARQVKSRPAEKRASPTPAPAESKLQISGQVTLSAGSGQKITADDQADTLVYFVPAKGASRPAPGHYTVYTNNRDFSPEAMAVPQGSTVTFVNLDDVRHNVFSVTPGAAFNLGYQASGDKVAHVFAHAGVVLISCMVHRSMELDLLVVPTAYSTKVAHDGRFSLRGLPAGVGTLHFWNPRAQPASQTLTLPMSGVIKQRVLLTKPSMKTQLNVVNAP